MSSTINDNNYPFYEKKSINEKDKLFTEEKFKGYFFSGQRYNLTGSSEFAVLGEAFTWTCDMFVPPGYTSNAVKFFRDNKLCVVIANTNAACATQRDNCGYSYKCVSESMFSLTIPAENMTEYENGSKWRCDYVVNVAGNASPQIVLNIASKKFK